MFSIRRCKSDTNVSYGKKHCRKREYSENGQYHVYLVDWKIGRKIDHDVVYAFLDNTDTNFETISLTSESKQVSKPKQKRKWRSLDSLKGQGHECASETHSRSASPAPSSGIENNSVKDAPIQIDVTANEQPELSKIILSGLF